MDATQTPPAAPDNEDENALEGPAAADENSLESPDTGGGDSGNGETNVTDATGESSTAGGPPKPPPTPPKQGIKQKLSRFNLYLLLFLFILVVAGGIVTIAYFQSKKASTNTTLQTESLTQSTLQQVASSDATVGSSNVVLNVESSAVFAGQVLVRSNLQVAGNLQIGGTVALNDLTVSGSSDLSQLSVSQNASIAGDTAIQGAETIGKSLQVNGGGTFSGPVSAPQLTVTTLQLNSDLVLTHHLIAGGPTPSRTSGPALGSGGTATVGGSDTSGTVTINTGSSPAAGCFVTITFASKYSDTPHVLVTPVGSAAGTLAYYVDRTSTNFSICDADNPPQGSSFAFDYLVVD